MASHDERVMRLLADPTKRAVLDVLNDTARQLSVTELADELVSREAVIFDSAEYEAKVDQHRVSLHHSHLPELDEAGLIEYDPDENVVSGGTLSSVAVEWEEITLLDELLSGFNGRHEPDGREIGVVEGKDEIYEYGRDLADTADDELFLIYTTDELLDESCLPNAKRAIERGVEFYAGAKCPSARRFFRRRLPEATVWEPQLDWMSDPERCPTISRLIFADRERVVVGLWDELAADGSKTEIGMIGEGRTNPFVVLVRELLGPRLDHLDYQSESFVRDLPFDP
ncbi:ArsR family transcriptional regulator [Natrialbaceae archaeon A-arb3/5]